MSLEIFLFIEFLFKKSINLSQQLFLILHYYAIYNLAYKNIHQNNSFYL